MKTEQEMEEIFRIKYQSTISRLNDEKEKLNREVKRLKDLVEYYESMFDDDGNYIG